MKFKFFNYESVSSTNDIAIKLIKEKRKKIGCVFAKTQTKGRGTRGKKWNSRKGNLFMSIFFSIKKEYPAFNEFFFINPVIISDVLKYLCLREKINFKWPNDVLLNKKKICGILQEIVNVSGKKFLIIGIGINVVSNPKIKTKYEATNILKETKKKQTVKKVLNLLISSYEKFFSNLKNYNYKDYKKKVNSMVIN